MTAFSRFYMTRCLPKRLPGATIPCPNSFGAQVHATRDGVPSPVRHAGRARTSWIRAMLAEPLGGIVIELVQEARASA